MQDDRELALLAAGGDEAAFVCLAERYRRFIYAVAWRVVLHEEDALDVTQEVLARLARVIGQYRGEGPFTAWLATLATREALNMLRRPARRERAVSPEIAANLADSGGGTPANARERIERLERLKLVHAAMIDLQPQQRAILALRLNDDMSSNEIAEKLELPPAQVRSQLARAVARLREMLADHRHD